MANKTKIISPYEGFQESFVRSNLDLVIGGGSMGGGKYNPLYTSVLTPRGWVKMGELRVGDTICTPFGKPAQVCHIFEHKNKDIYEIETIDGRKARCGIEHLWSFRTKEQFEKFITHKDMSRDLTTEDTAYMLRMMEKGQTIFLPIPYAQGFREMRHDINPFEFGAAGNSFIPNEYLWGSIEQRKQILNGLICAYGKSTPNNDIILCVSRETLAKDILYICRSLGLVAYYNEIMNECYHITISDEKTKRGHVEIISITKVDKCDARCIWIDDPLHLYIIDDFIVTHNTAAAVLSVAEPILDPKFRAVFLRNNLGDLKSGGGILDEFRKIYGSYCTVTESGDPHIDFPSGARIDVTHIADQTKDKVLQRFKGRQYDFIYFDEGTGFTWECFCAVYSRNRGVGKWTGKVRMTTNPKRNHWLRVFLDWYIGADGYIIPEHNGVVRYFYVNGSTVHDVVWGDSKEEVYGKCRISIDRTLRRYNGVRGNATYKDIIKSFTFYEGKMAENKSIDSGYVGSVAMMGGADAQANLEANWNVDTDELITQVVTNEESRSVFLNDPQINGDKWVTCDLADTGTDNFVALAWNGLHIIDFLILKHTTPKKNAEMLLGFAKKHDISNSHIIYDGIRGIYINDYISEAIPFFSYKASMGMYKREAYNLKAECYLRLVEVIKRRYISFDDRIAKMRYDHSNIKEFISIETEFVEECSVIRFKDMPSGKKALFTKKEMNAKLGRNRSMDLLDPVAMRFYPLLPYAYGEELSSTSYDVSIDDNEDLTSGESIYDNYMYG